MKTFFATAFTLASVSTASVTTLYAPFPGFAADESWTLYGSVIAVSPDVTSVSLDCIPTDTSCKHAPHRLLAYGPSTWSWNMADPAVPHTVTDICSFKGQTAVCLDSISITGSVDSETITYTEAGSMVIVVTAGEEKLTATATTPTTSTAEARTTTGALARSTASDVLMKASVSPTGEIWEFASSSTTAPKVTPTGAAGMNVAGVGTGLLGVAAGVFGGLLI